MEFTKNGTQVGRALQCAPRVVPDRLAGDCQPYLPELFQARLNLRVDGVIRLQNYAATAEDRL